jgi:hypothetical protein
MHHCFFTLMNGGGLLCTISRLKAKFDKPFEDLLSNSTCTATPRC